MPKIKKTDIDKLDCPEGQSLVFLWDSTLPGFGVRCTQRGIKSFVIRYRTGPAGRKKQRIKTLGRVSILDLSDARSIAREKLGEAHKGEDPFIASASDIQTIEDLSKAFQEGRRHELKPKTLESYESLWKHINAAIGDTPIVSITEDSVRALRKALGDKPTTFNRCVSLVLSSLKWQGALTENHPFKRAKKFKENQRQRILSRKENADFYAALGQYKRNRSGGWRYADLFILLLLTGLRRDEWRKGRWEWIHWDTGLYTMPDTKTGEKVKHLSTLALDVLKVMHAEQRSPKKGFIFPAPSDKKKPLSWTWRLWDNMRKEVGLDGFRIHDMRHTAGSFAHSVGNLTQRQVADFLGHARLETSSRYIHDQEKRESAEAAAQAISGDWRAE